MRPHIKLLFTVLFFFLVTDLNAQNSNELNNFLERQPVSVDEIQVSACPSDIQNRKPDRTVLQTINDTFHKWHEYDMADGSFCIELARPYQKLLNKLESKNLLKESRSWSYNLNLSGYETNDNDEVKNTISSETPILSKNILGIGEKRIFGDDDRTRILFTEEFPLNTVAKMNYSVPSDTLVYRCTAFFVSKYVALTAGHCVDDTDSATLYPGQTQIVTNGATVRPYSHVLSNDFEHHPEFNPLPGFSDHKHDMGAVRFSTLSHFEEVDTFMPVTFEANTSDLNSLGFPSEVHEEDSSQAMWFSYDKTDAQIGGSEGQLWYTTMDASSGQSGSPFYTVINDKPSVVGIYTGYKCITNEEFCPNTGPRFTAEDQNLILNWMSWEPTLRTLSINTSSIDFETTVIGNSVTQTISISNDESANSELTGDVSITGTDFSIDSVSGSFNLNPGESHNVVVRFSPTSPEGSKTGTLTITHNATNISSPTEIDITGHAVTSTTPVLSASTNSLDFGDVELDETLAQTYTLSGENLSVNVDISTPDGFQVSTSCANGFQNSLSLTPSGGIINEEICVLFDPATISGYSGKITNSSSEVVPVEIDVNGNGIENTDNPNLSIVLDPPFIVDEEIDIRLETDPVTEGLQFDFSVSPNDGTLTVYNEGYTNKFGTANASFVPSSSGSFTVTATSNSLGEISETFNVSSQTPPTFAATYISGDDTKSTYRLEFEYQGFSWNNDAFELETDNGIFKKSGSQRLTGTLTDQDDFSADMEITDAVETTITLTHNGNKFDYKFIPQIVTNEEISTFHVISSNNLYGFDWVTTDNSLLVGNGEDLLKYDIHSWDLIQRKRDFASKDIDEVATSRDGTKLAFADDDRVHLADAVNMEKLQSSNEFNTSKDMIISWSWDGSKIAAVDNLDHFVLSSSSLGTLKNFSNPIDIDVDFRKNSSHYAIGRDENDLKQLIVYKTSNYSEVKSMKIGINGERTKVSYSPDGRYLAASFEDAGLYIFDATNNYSQVANISDDYGTPTWVRWNPNPDHNIIALASKNDEIYFYDADTYQRVTKAPINFEPYKMKWSKDGLVLGASNNLKLHLIAPFNQTPPILTTDFQDIINQEVLQVDGLIENFSDYASVAFILNGEQIKEIDITNEQGSFSEEISLSVGENTLTLVAKDRFLNETQKQFTIERTNNTTISGVTLDESSNPVSGVAVSISGGKNETVNTDENGFYSFTVEKGLDYKVTASLAGFDITPEVVELTSIDQTAEINFTVTVSDDIINFTYQFEGDWNFIGPAVEAESSTLIMSHENAIRNSLYGFDSEQGTYYGAESMEKGDGYWVKFYEASELQVEGLQFHVNEISLNKGWNLISGLSSAIMVNQIQDPDGVLTGSVYGFENGSYRLASELSPGAGYWVQASNSGIISLDNQVGKMINNEVDLIANKYKPQENFNSLFFTSREDTLRTLYFGNQLPEQIDQTQYKLPPIPPTGSFDARFSSVDSWLTESSNGAIKLQVPEDEYISVHLETNTMKSSDSWKITQLADDVRYREDVLRDGDSMELYSSDIDKIILDYIKSDTEANSEQPISYTLEQNYPNPFNPTTQIQFSLPEQAQVNISIYNVVGQKVGEAVNRLLEAGQHSVSFDASGLPSGIYFYKMQAGSFQDIKKLTVIK